MSASLLSGTAISAAMPNFTEIPVNWRVPGNYMEIRPAVNLNALLAFPAKGFVTGQMYAAGTATAGQEYLIYSAAQANGLFGAGSQLAEMCAAWLKVNPYTPLYAIGVDDMTGSTKAAGSVTIAGTATAPGTLPLRFAGVRVTTPVHIGDTAAEVAANLYAQLQLQGQSGYPYIPSLVPSYTAASAVVDLTCGHGGTLGNEIDIRVDTLQGDAIPAGLTVTIAAMAGGATDPEAAISAMVSSFSRWYTDIAWPWTDPTNLGVITQYLVTSYGAMKQRDAQAYVTYDGTYGTALAFAPNSQFISCLPAQNQVTPPWILAAAFAAACCYQTAQQPALQLKTVPLPGIVAPDSADLFTEDERQALLEAGHSTFYVDDAGNMYLERVVTTYRTDAGGNLNNAYFDLNTTKVPTRVRYDWDLYVSEVYPRNMLCPDGSIAADFNEDAVTPKMLKASWTTRSLVYEKNGWIKNSAQTAAASSFEIDPNDGNRCDAAQQINIMGNLMVLAGQLQFISNN